MDLNWDYIKTVIKNLKGLTAIGSANLVATASLALFWLFMASVLDVEDYGEISYLLSIATIAGTIALLGAGNTLVVYRAKQVKIQGTIYFLSIIVVIITSFILYVILINVNISLYLIGSVLFGLVGAELLGTKMYNRFAKFLISQRILMVSLAFGMYYFLGPQGIILGFGLSFFPYSWLIYRGFKESKIEFALIRSRIKFFINSYVLDLARISNIHIDRLIIASILGFTVLGNYQLGLQVVSLMTILPSIVFQYILPREASGQENIKLKQATVITAVILAVLAIIFAPKILPTLFSKFVQTSEIIQIMSLQIIPSAITYMYMSKFLAKEKSKTVVIGSGIGIIIRVPAVILMGQILGINGVAIAFVLAATAEAIYLFTIDKVKSSN